MSANYIQTINTRVSLLTLLGAFGGLMYTIKNIGNAFNRKSADFALDNDMMRRLYSVEAGEGDEFKQRLKNAKKGSIIENSSIWENGDET